MSSLTGRPTCPRLVALEVTAHGEKARGYRCANVFCLERPPNPCDWSEPFTPADSQPLPTPPAKAQSRFCDACQETDWRNADGSWPREWRRWYQFGWVAKLAGHIHLACYSEWAAKHPDRTGVAVCEADVDD